jgi:hypothetical protein
MPVPLHLLMICHVLVRHQKHYNVCSMFVMNIHVNGVSALMQNKSYILQFSLNPREKNLIFNWHIGDDTIPSSDNCCHLGIEMNSCFKATERTTNACRKVRNVFFAINGIMSNSTKPCVLVTFYKSVVLPTVLYGCEMWNNLKSVDLTNLNTFQHFIVKRIQNLRPRTRSDIVKGYLESILFHPTLTLENC